MLPWNKNFSKEELIELEQCYDLFVTSPTAWFYLKTQCNYNPKKVVMVTHGEKDLNDFLSAFDQTEFNDFYKYAVVSDWLKQRSLELGIQRIPEVVWVGINTARFNLPISNSLKTVGYAGTFNRRHPSEVKRPHLVEEAVKQAGLDFKVAEKYGYSFVSMPGFYKSVDAIVIASQQEGACLPMLEGGAAGKLIISTPVGHWDKKVTDKGGIAVPLDEKLYLEKTVEVLLFYKDNPEEYRKKCTEIKNHAVSYDWKHVLTDWVKLLT